MRVRNIAELHALQKSGGVKHVEGVKFLETSKPDAPAPAPQQSLEPLVTAIRDSMAKQSELSGEQMKAIYQLVLGIARAPKEQPLLPPPARPLRWVFKVVRNEDGFVSEIVAEASP